MKARTNLGHRGEQAAVNFLLAHGWIIINRNVRLGKKEIDIIASKNKHIALFEIKTRIEAETNNPISNVQRDTLRLAHLEYCDQNNINPETVAYNLIIINYFKGQANLEYYSDFL